MPKTDSSAIPADFLKTQVELLQAGKSAELASRYTEDAMIVRSDMVGRGREEIKGLFDAYLAQNPVIKSVDLVLEEDNVIVYEAKETLNGKLITATGVLVFVDGQVWRQGIVFVDPFNPA